MIKFKNVTYKNFKSIGNSAITIEFDKFNSTLITGKNGVGKSTLMSAVFFCLFGEDYILTKGALINSINQKQLHVAITFEIGDTVYKVERGIKPNIFKIFKTNVGSVFEEKDMLNKDSDNRDYQKVLESQILKMDKRAFKQVVSVGSRHYVPFMKLGTKDRREFIEDLLDIRIFSTMGELLKGQAKTLREEVKEIDDELKTIKEKVALQEAFVKKLTNEKSVSIAKVETGIGQLRSTISSINNSIQSETGILSKLVDTVSQYSNIHADKSKLVHELSGLRVKKQNHISKVKFYEETTTCPTCTQLIADSHRDIISFENGTAIDECSLLIIEIEEKLIAIQEKIDQQNNLNKEIANTQDIINVYQNQVKTNLSIIERAEKQIEDLNCDSSSIDVEKTKLREFAKRFIELDKKKKVILEAQQYQELTQKILADDGIKTKIIKQYIPQINKFVNMYLEKLDFFCLYYLDENFNETVKARHRDKFTYDNFSDGQAAKIDLALMFAWRDIARMRNAVNCNLCFFDEADKAIDTEGSSLLIDLLKSMENSNIFIISHKGDTLSDKVDRVIEFDVVDNFTVMK